MEARDDEREPERELERERDRVKAKRKSRDGWSAVEPTQLPVPIPDKAPEVGHGGRRCRGHKVLSRTEPIEDAEEPGAEPPPGANLVHVQSAPRLSGALRSSGAMVDRNRELERIRRQICDGPKRVPTPSREYDNQINSRVPRAVGGRHTSTTVRRAPREDWLDVPRAIRTAPGGSRPSGQQELPGRGTPEGGAPPALCDESAPGPTSSAASAPRAGTAMPRAGSAPTLRRAGSKTAVGASPEVRLQPLQRAAAVARPKAARRLVFRDVDSWGATADGD